MKYDALISECGTYRYALHRLWGNGERFLLVVMLNPSTADHTKDDPTITRLIKRAQSGLFDGLTVVNLYAYRSPSPRELQKQYDAQRDIIGKINDQVISEELARCQTVLVAWGNHKLVNKRERHVLTNIQRLHNPFCLGLTNYGYPRHPLHVSYNVEPMPYRGRFSSL